MSTLEEVVLGALVGHVVAISNVKWTLPRQHLVEEDTQSPPVHGETCRGEERERGGRAVNGISF